MLKKFIAPIAIGGALLVGGIASTGTAFASTPAAATATASTAKHPARAWLRAHKREIRRDGVAISAKTIGVTPKALVTELRTGKSIADVATEHGVSPQTVVNALVTAADAKVTTAVNDHKLTAAQGTKIDAALPTYVAKAVNHTFK